jgi:hypothetical protein
VDPELTGFVFCPAAGENPLGGAHEKIVSFSPPGHTQWTQNAAT